MGDQTSMGEAAKTTGDAEHEERPGTGKAPLKAEHALLIIAALAIAFTLYLAASLILPILIAAFLAILLAPAVRALVSLRLPQTAAAAVIVIVTVGLSGMLLFHLYSPVQTWLSTEKNVDLRALERKLGAFRAPVEAVKSATKTVESIAEGQTRPPKPVVKVESGSPLDMFRTMHTVLLTTLTTILLVYFLLASGNLLLRKLVQATPKLRDKIRTIEIAHSLQREISAYFATVTFINVGLGLVTAATMWLLGMPVPLALGVMAALLNFLPYVGPLLTTAALSAVALVTFDTPTAIILPPAIYLLLHLIEGQLIVPYVLGQRISVNPVILFIWVLIFTWLWGAPGAVLALPILVAVRICAERLPSLQLLATLLEGDVDRSAPVLGVEEVSAKSLQTTPDRKPASAS